jgi:large subunit ribosomal protein L3
LSHGAGYPHRYQGSLAFGRGGSSPQRVYKGKKMHGHYGHETVTMQNLSVVSIMPNDNVIIISGAIPGPEGSIITIRTSFKKGSENIKYDIVTKEIQSKIEKENLKLEDKETAKEMNEEVEKKEEAIEVKKEAEKAKKDAELKHEKLLEKEKEK